MKSWTLCLSAGVLTSLANAGCIASCGSPRCFAAVGADADAGESFCSSWLSLTPATTTVTELATVTSTVVDVEISLTTLTVTTETATITGTDVSTIFLKRAPTITQLEVATSTSPVDAIMSKCSSNDERISRACSCLLSTATASTVTVFETAASTVAVETISTVVSTVTENVEATVSVDAPPVTIPTNIIPNGNFESYVKTGNILPWTDLEPDTGGRLDVVNGVNPCTSSYCAGGQVVIRPYPPNTPGGYRGLRQTFVGRPSTTYNVSFLYRCLNYDALTRIEVWYAGVRIGIANQCINSAAFSRASGIQFTTDSTGRGELQVRFVGSGGTPYLYFYADDFQAVAA